MVFGGLGKAIDKAADVGEIAKTDRFELFK